MSGASAPAVGGGISFSPLLLPNSTRSLFLSGHPGVFTQKLKDLREQTSKLPGLLRASPQTSRVATSAAFIGQVKFYWTRPACFKGRGNSAS